MPLDYERDTAAEVLGHRSSYGDQDVILYALSLGMGTNPLDENELQFVNEAYLQERPVKVMPTFAAVAAFRGGAIRLDVNRIMVVDGGRDLTLHKPMPPQADIAIDNRIAEIYDKGEGRGAVVARETMVRDARTGALYATLLSYSFARGDGGFGGPPKIQPPPHEIPERTPDRSIEITTTAGQALLYRLCGDRNPLHSDPEFAAQAGFPRPILHGMCTYGLTARAVLQTYADYDPSAFERHAARFSAPVFPGETIKVDLWRDGSIVSFQARVEARDVTVVKNGISVLR